MLVAGRRGRGRGRDRPGDRHVARGERRRDHRPGVVDQCARRPRRDRRCRRRGMLAHRVGEPARRLPRQQPVLPHDPVRLVAGAWRSPKRSTTPVQAGPRSRTSTMPIGQSVRRRLSSAALRGEGHRAERSQFRSRPTTSRSRPRPTKVATTSAGVVVVIGDATSGPVMLGAIDAAESATQPELRGQRRDAPSDGQRRADGQFAWPGGSRASRPSRTAPTSGSSTQLGADSRQPKPVRGQRVRLRQPHRPRCAGQQFDAARRHRCADPGGQRRAVHRACRSQIAATTS